MGQNYKTDAKKTFSLNNETYNYYSLKTLVEKGFSETAKLPYSIRVPLESVLRQYDGEVIKDEHIEALAKWDEGDFGNAEVPFKPSRVILQDFTGVPAVVDLASLRHAMGDLGGVVLQLRPRAPEHLVIDHSVQVDECGTQQALQNHMALEFE